MYEIKMIRSPDDVQDEALRTRAERAHCARSQEFVAIVNDEEAGFISYENWKDQSLGFIYEIFILPYFRQHGIAASLLKYAEAHAVLLGCSSMRLKPHALDQETNIEQLVSWYARNGYARRSNKPEEMEKDLSAPRF